jgi:uncharacterized protein (UPF0276 family)
LKDLPELGVGLVYAPGLEPLLEAGQECIDVIEVEPQTLWFKMRLASHSYRLDKSAIDRLALYPQPKIIHGVGFPVGGSTSPDGGHVEPLVETTAAFHSPWVSEHLSFNRVTGSRRSFGTGFLLPPSQTPAGAALAISNIRHVRSQVLVPFAFETGVNYLQPYPGEMSDGAYFATIAEEADSGILLDIHNLWANERNGRQPVLDVVDELPLDRVWEVHLAGGDEFNGYWVDSHSGLVSPSVIDLAADIIPRLPNLKAIIFEIGPDFIEARQIPIRDLLAQIRAIRTLWDHRATSPYQGRHTQERDVTGVTGPTPEEWEEAIGTLVIGGKAQGSLLATRLADDPGIEVYRHLIEAARAGMVVDALKLTSRYLMLHIGDGAFRQLLRDFWRDTPPELFPSEESWNFGQYLERQRLDTPHLYEVLAFELESHAVLIDGAPRLVRFSCDPGPLLTAIAAGRLPERIGDGNFDLEIQPLLPS